MKSPNPTSSGGSAKETRVAYLLEELRASRSPTIADHMIVFMLILCTVGVAWLQGFHFFIVWAVGLSTIFVPLAIVEARMRRWMDLLIGLVSELEKGKLGEPEDGG